MPSNLEAARTLHGIPIEQHRLPYPNFRSLLSLHAKTASDKDLLIQYDANGERSTVTYARFNGLVHQTANFLYDDLGLRRGDRVGVIAENNSDTLVIYCACWLIGVAVIPLSIHDDRSWLNIILNESQPVVCFVPHVYVSQFREISNSTLVIQLGGTPNEHFIHFRTAIKDRPNSFIGADASEVRIEDEALISYTRHTNKGVILTQYNLLINAMSISHAHAITGHQRMLCVLPLHRLNTIVTGILTPLYAGATIFLMQDFGASQFWEYMVRERVNVAHVIPEMLQLLLNYAQECESEGQTLYGNGINRQALLSFRHFISSEENLPLSLTREFTTKFGMTIINSYGISEAAGCSASIPASISWDEYKSWMLDHDYPCIGAPIESNEMAIFDRDGYGRQLAAGEHGEIYIRGHNIMKSYINQPQATGESFRFGWFRTGDSGFYLVDDNGRAIFYITGKIE